MKVKDVQLEMEEMHDQFREEEAIEFRELQKNWNQRPRVAEFSNSNCERQSEEMSSWRQRGYKQRTK